MIYGYYSDFIIIFKIMSIAQQNAQFVWPQCIDQNSTLKTVMGDELTCEQANEVIKLFNYPACWNLYSVIECANQDQHVTCLFLLSLIERFEEQCQRAGIVILPTLQFEFSLIRARVFERMAVFNQSRLGVEIWYSKADQKYGPDYNESNWINRIEGWYQMAKVNYAKVHALAEKIFVPDQAMQSIVSYFCISLQAIDARLAELKCAKQAVDQFTPSFQPSR